MNKIYEKLGASLKLERERRKVSLEEIAAELRVSVGTLESIEAGDASRLPSEVYFRLFAKAYAESLGIDYTRTVEAIREDLGETAEPAATANGNGKQTPSKKEPPVAQTVELTAELPEPSKRRPVTLKTVGIIFGVLIVAGVAVIVITWRSGNNKKEQPYEQVTAGPVEEDRSRQVSSEPYGTYDWNVREFGEPSGLALTLIARGETWGTVVADGDTVLHQNLVPGQTYDLKGKSRLVVSVALASDVDILLNGRPVNLADPVTRRIARVEINQMNLSSFLTDQSVPGPTEVIERADDTLGSDTSGNRAVRPGNAANADKTKKARP
jgi:transcriptional regulator with XRE-family HTH domain